jgi:hypothetical protein
VNSGHGQKRPPLMSLTQRLVLLNTEPKTDH